MDLGRSCLGLCAPRRPLRTSGAASLLGEFYRGRLDDNLTKHPKASLMEFVYISVGHCPHLKIFQVGEVV